MYLVGYCHAFRFCPGGQHVEYREASRTPHEGTTEFISMDAHKGAGESRLWLLTTNISVSGAVSLRKPLSTGNTCKAPPVHPSADTLDSSDLFIAVADCNTLKCKRSFQHFNKKVICKSEGLFCPNLCCNHCACVLSLLAPSRRSDLQSLGYCMLRWHTGTLPWTHLADPDQVATEKHR